MFRITVEVTGWVFLAALSLAALAFMAISAIQ